MCVGEHDFVMLDTVADAVFAELDSRQSRNVDRAAVTVTGEGPEVEIVIVPHRDLGGVSLVVWNDSRATELRWAQIGSLEYHDDIDLGIAVARVEHQGEWKPGLREELRRELRRPISLRGRAGLFGHRIECSIQTTRERRIGVLRGKEARLAGRAVTSLTGGPDLGFSIRIPLEAWRRSS